MKFQSTLNITFIGCLANEIENVEQFRLEDSMFTYLNDTPGLAFIIITESLVTIQRTSFLSPIGSVQNYSSLYTQAHHYPLEFYGAIISLNSKLVIYIDSTFEGSQTQFTGGAIYAEKNDLVMMRCNFSHSKRACKHLCFGGALSATLR